jgi:nicotinamidase-related amidase
MLDIEQVTPTPSPELLTPDDTIVVLIDYQPQMFFGTGSGERSLIINAATGLAKATRIFDVPAVLTTVAANSFSGPILTELAEALPGQEIIDRTSMNAWEDPRVVDAIKRSGRTKIVLAGLWTEVCIVLPALSALNQGYRLYAAIDACGGTSPEAHQHAVERLIQAGVAPMTWVQVLLELQRDWARTNTYKEVMELVKAHAGAYGQGVRYAQEFLGVHTAG